MGRCGCTFIRVSGMRHWVSTSLVTCLRSRRPYPSSSHRWRARLHPGCRSHTTETSHFVLGSLTSWQCRKWNCMVLSNCLYCLRTLASPGYSANQPTVRQARRRRRVYSAPPRLTTQEQTFLRWRLLPPYFLSFL